MSEYMLEIQQRSLELDQALQAPITGEQRNELIRKHLQDLSSSASSSSSSSILPPFSADWTWFNVLKPLAADHLLGRVVVLDFFTYCCINCMHILPDLEALEKEHADKGRVLVVGVHSAKFENEKTSSNIANAIRRYGIHHPVVNDSGIVWWTELGISCWPTLLVLDPKSRPVRMFVGEGHRDELLEFVDAVLEFYGDDIRSPPKSLPEPASVLGQELSPRLLSFPGKVFCSGDRLFISDTGNNRIVISDVAGSVSRIVGSGERGFVDGGFTEARFSQPQGLCLISKKVLVVADTGNHALRLIDLESEQVTTLAGTGEQGKDLVGGKTAAEQPVASPWDVCLGHSLSSKVDNPDTLYVAMAGSHQVWGYALEESVWWKGTKRAKGTLFSVAGSGQEENRNNSYPNKAGFAQPSGVAYSATHRSLFIADSESSSIRQLNIGDGSVKNICGGSRDPTDLFSYGLVDGAGMDAKFQHPLGVAFRASDETLLVADSYNHVIRVILGLGGGKKCLSVTLDTGSVKLDEPGGVCLSDDGDRLFVADTNNHVIKVVDLKERKCFDISPSVAEDVVDKTAPRKGAKVIDLEVIKAVHFQGPGSVEFVVNFKPNFLPPCKLNLEAPSSWQLSTSEGLTSLQGNKGKLIKPCQWKLRMDPSGTDSFDFAAEITAYLCNAENGICYMKRILARLHIKKTEDGSVIPSAIDLAVDVL